MRRAAILLVLLGVAAAGPRAQQPSATERAATSLPVKRVVLYKAGVGYFEHVGDVTGNEQVTISFTSGQLDDALKSLTAVDLGSGRVTGIRYNSVAPIEERLRALRIPLDETTSLPQLLTALRGARVTVKPAAGLAVPGRLVSLDTRSRVRGEHMEEYQLVIVAGDGGELRSFELTPSLSIALGELDLRRELGEYLRIVGSSRARDVRRMTVSTEGTGRRPLLVSYISEVPVWKVNYRLVLDSDAKARPVLHAWAIVDNTVGEDWSNVELSLIAGAPQSFIQRVSQPIYTRRPVIALPSTALLTPQTHSGTLRVGVTGVRGRVTDPSDAPLPGATVALLNPAGTLLRSLTTGPDGTYAFSPVEEGTYQLRATLAGFNPASSMIGVSRGSESVVDLQLAVSGVMEEVAVSGQSPAVSDRRSRASSTPGAVPGGVVGGVVGGLPGAPPPPPAPTARAAEAFARIAAEAEAQPSGDAFEYRLKQPITVRRNESALVPIARAEIEADKVTLWSARSGRALRAVWIINSSGLTLDGGTFSLIDDGAFAGEGLVEVIKPGERRLLSYAADPGVRVEPRQDEQAMRIFRARARDGLLMIQRERRERATYTIRNDNDQARTVVVEHPVRDGWVLSSSVEPAEKAVGVARFRVSVDAHKTASFTVSESRPEETGIGVTDISHDFLKIVIEGGLPADAVERAFGPVLAKRAEAEAARRELQTRHREIAGIERDQQRLRENLKALSESRADRGLVNRYTRQMGEQEDRLAVLRADVSRLEAEVTKLQLEAQRLLDTIMLEAPAR